MLLSVDHYSNSNIGYSSSSKVVQKYMVTINGKE